MIERRRQAHAEGNIRCRSDVDVFRKKDVNRMIFKKFGQA